MSRKRETQFETLWWTIHYRKGDGSWFTVNNIRFHHAFSGGTAKRKTIGSYCRWLARAGYLESRWENSREKSYKVTPAFQDLAKSGYCITLDEIRNYDDSTEYLWYPEQH